MFPLSVRFLSLCLLSCLCNRLHILPQVLNLSFLPLCQFLLALVFPFPVALPASHTRSYFLLHPLSHGFAALASSFCPHRGVASPLGCPCTHISFLSLPSMDMCRICIFTVLRMDPKIRDFYTFIASFQSSDSYLVIHNK